MDHLPSKPVTLRNRNRAVLSILTRRGNAERRNPRKSKRSAQSTQVETLGLFRGAIRRQYRSGALSVWIVRTAESATMLLLKKVLKST
jgi:hypothetical protein